MADISAARLNNLQSRLELILGNGAGQNGYGQTLNSYPVSNLIGVIAAADINSIYADMVRARVHQIGTQPTEIAQLVSNLNIIGEESSYQLGDDGVTVTDPSGNLKGILDYERLMSQIELDKFLVHSSQASIEAGISSSRTAEWNGIIYHEVTVNFNNADHRRHFFNTGSNIRFNGSNSGAIGDKGKDWNMLLIEIGSVSFGHATTYPTGSGIGSAIGNFGLTDAYQTIFTKVGSGTYSGVYAGNIYTIKARAPNSSSIQFKIELNDVVTDPAVDNNVEGRLISNIQHTRADSASVSVPAPTYTNTVALS